MSSLFPLASINKVNCKTQVYPFWIKNQMIYSNTSHHIFLRVAIKKRSSDELLLFNFLWPTKRKTWMYCTHLRITQNSPNIKATGQIKHTDCYYKNKAIEVSPTVVKVSLKRVINYFNPSRGFIITSCRVVDKHKLVTFLITKQTLLKELIIEVRTILSR